MKVTVSNGIFARIGRWSELSVAGSTVVVVLQAASRFLLSVKSSIFFFFLGGRDIHYKDAMKETTSVCEGHPQQKLQATRTT